MRRWPAISLSAAIVVGACSPYTVTHNPAPPLPVPESYDVDSDAGSEQSGQPGLSGQGAPMPEKWWIAFNDPQLDLLIAQTMRGNFQLRAAWARVKQARAFVAQANSGKYPQLDLTGSIARQKSRFNFRDQVIINENNSFSASIGAGYELDLWRRMANNADGATLDAMALRDDVEAIAITLAAEVAEAWFDLLSVSAQIRLLEEQLATNQTYLELIELRFQRGLASSLDIYQQRQQLVSTQSQVTLLQGSATLLRQRLAILVGKPAATIRVRPGDVLPSLPGAVPGTGIPADLLERRPDVRAARRRVEAADHRVAVAVAERLPSLRLAGSAGLSAPSLGDFLTSPVWNLLASVAAPLIDGGRRKAEVERNKAIVEERLMQYGHALLQAMTEVEGALANEVQQRAYIDQLVELVELAGATLEQAQVRYQQGLIDYLPVLSALQGKQRLEVQLLQAQRSLLSHRIQLCRALGGMWTRDLEAPKAQRPSERFLQPEAAPETAPKPAPKPTPETAPETSEDDPSQEEAS